MKHPRTGARGSRVGTWAFVGIYLCKRFPISCILLLNRSSYSLALKRVGAHQDVDVGSCPILGVHG